MTPDQIYDFSVAGGIVLAFATGVYICYLMRFRIR